MNTTGSSDSIHSLRASMHKPSATPTLQICIPPAIYPPLTDSGAMCIRHWPSSASWNLFFYKEESAAEQAQDEAFYLAAKVQLYDFLPPQWTFWAYAFLGSLHAAAYQRCR